MGTISDKLMRIINTKEDIRQALISKGYDVPTSIPFKEYAKMISDLPCKVDDFPKLPGDVTRWYFGGLTNEMMAAMDDPRIEDADHKGRFLSFKNFAWGGMSGVGGYTENYNSNKWYKVESRIDATWTYKSFNARSIKDNRSAQLFYQSSLSDTGFRVLSCTIKVSGLTDGQGIEYVSNGTQQFVIMRIENDGIYHLPSFDFGAKNAYYGFKFLKLQESCNITIEQLPLYPGALVFDGVDDYGICDNFPILTKEKGYTVVALRQYLVEKSTAYLTANGDSIPNTSFILEGNNYRDTWNFGRVTTIQASRILATQTSKQYNGVKLNIGTNTEGSNLLQVGKWSKSYSNVAIWELVFLDHDATEEELTKIKDYFVKTYPWLFPDQAWTVTGKTNEDEDHYYCQQRTKIITIANITGNGNDLVLSNFGFAEGSGYGLYYQYFGNEFKATNGEIEGGGWNIIDNYNISHDKRIPINSIGKCFWGNKALVNGIKLRFKLTGMTEGDVLAFGYAATYDLTYTSDGIYAIDLPPVDKSYGFSLQSSLTENLPTTPVTIELLPFEYEGYLVTDGVDDKIVSSSFGMGKDFTIVGDWKFIDNKKSGTGLVKGSSFYIYNTMTGLDLYINSGSVKNSLDGIKSINAACSDGRAYDRNWNEILANTGNVVGSGGTLEVSSSGGRFDRIAFKNLAIYPRILSKDDCIKAYNYLQTLKSK